MRAPRSGAGGDARCASESASRPPRTQWLPRVSLGGLSPPGSSRLGWRAAVRVWGLISGPCCAHLVCSCIFVSLPSWCGRCGLPAGHQVTGASGSALPQVLGLGARTAVSLLFCEEEGGRSVTRIAVGVFQVDPGRAGVSATLRFPGRRRALVRACERLEVSLRLRGVRARPGRLLSPLSRSPEVFWFGVSAAFYFGCFCFFPFYNFKFLSQFQLT